MTRSAHPSEIHQPTLVCHVIFLSNATFIKTILHFYFYIFGKKS